MSKNETLMYVVVLDFEALEDSINKGQMRGTLSQAESLVESYKGSKNAAGKALHYEILKVQYETIKKGRTV